ncbi:hypothetical protein CC85DRAFT_325878 [Cutaneotrichosporon oleaginosum]|uniref:Uncharacterized protein n=1 Tax=Cutaneotrichosporon oleaginosum TaxID=879819 RepID=A0A0J0XWD4_9TREE|nr:uncharacterized protein CC85DRAFT_325878 [Cutaneotrichosporon oleaginosum]KLT45373.1 hypothetical protein CC85DRAFT_325878 [Cutaneotrichosporon oleaginosum]TXT14803.1 hypothetical protein COLE_00996 [Cutaneotrichosporon oleaginosum]
MRPTLKISRCVLSRAASSKAAVGAALAPAAARDPGAHLRRSAAPEPAYLPTSAVSGEGRARSALFGQYPTRTKVNYAARRAKPASTAWRHDPVAVMQNTPLRRCAVSRCSLHTAYMLNLRALLVRDTRGTPRVIAAPDGLRHPRYAGRRTGLGAWVALRRDIVAGIGHSKRQLANITKGPPKIPDNLLEQVEGELVTRVAQELELLRARVAAAPAGEGVDAARVLRPLSPAEVDGVAHGAAPRSAIAVLDVRFGARSRLTEAEREHPTVRMLRREGANSTKEGDVPLFPLHALLGAEPRCAALVEDVLAAQRVFARRCAEAAGGHVTTPTDEVEAHRAEEEAALVAVQIPQIDSGRDGGVPLVVALWRVSLWRGEGWDLVEAAGEGGEGSKGGEGGEEAEGGGDK